jgi:hypothetical protein
MIELKSLNSLASQFNRLTELRANKILSPDNDREKIALETEIASFFLRNGEDFIGAAYASIEYARLARALAPLIIRLFPPRPEPQATPASS